ncbi:methyltransferase [Sedimenticola selenatireducens]|uniref:spermidine synthase n=1 Tax=Sedimenticola selenatireducens TaxID=191960 RepID=UPI002AAC1CDB|nr:methyltransferase [Sedimenticola selenatireducens]
MPQSGQLLHHCRDEWGDLSVHQDAGRRMLCFGNTVEQSCIDIHQPARLCHHYTQVMMLGFLLAPTVRHCTLLGLGAGALAQAVLAHHSGCKIDAVEMRPKVVELAQTWFALPDDKRLRLHPKDAWEYLNHNPVPTDLILTDLYLGGGMNELQARQHFLAACRGALKPNGILICNYWLKSSLTSHALNEALQTVFDQQVVTLSIPDGNCIAFAFDGGIPRLHSKQFMQAAEALGKNMDIPLQKHARALLHENRQAFRYSHLIEQR